MESSTSASLSFEFAAQNEMSNSAIQRSSSPSELLYVIGCMRHTLNTTKDLISPKPISTLSVRS